LFKLKILKKRDFEDDFDEYLEEWMYEFKESMKEFKESMKEMVLDLKDNLTDLKDDLTNIFDSNEITEERESIF